MAKTNDKRSFRLLSTSLVNTPGILRWAQNGYKFKKDRKALLRVFVETYTGENCPTSDEFHRLLLGEITWTEEQQEDGYKCVCFDC